MRIKNTSDVTINFKKKTKKNKDSACFSIRNKQLCAFEYVNVFKNSNEEIVFKKSNPYEGRKLTANKKDTSGHKYLHFQYEKAREFAGCSGNYFIDSIREDAIICVKMPNPFEDNAVDNAKVLEKPPLGLEPRDIFEMRMRSYRRNEIVKAMRRYQEAKKQIPDEWLTELEELC